MTTSTDRYNGLIGSSGIKPPVVVATLTNISLSGLQTIDGVALAENDRVLVHSQTIASENGIYLASSGAWTRAKDFNGKFDAQKGTLINVSSGTTYANTLFQLDVNDAVIGTTDLSFLQKNINVANVAPRITNYGVSNGGAIEIQTSTAAAFSSIINEGKTELVFPKGNYLVGGNVSLAPLLENGNRFKLIFEDDAILKPKTDYDLESDADILKLEGFATGTYTALSSDAGLDSDSITLSSSIGGSVNDYLEIKSDALLPGTNNKNTYQFQVFRIVAISGTTYTLDRTLDYDFLVSDNAEARLCTVYRGLTLENLQLNSLDYTTKMKRGFIMSYVDDIHFKDRVSAYGTKDRYGSDVTGRSALVFNNALNVTIDNLRSGHLGYYFIDPKNFNYNILINNPRCFDGRHLELSNHATNTNEYVGECHTIICYNPVVEKTTLSGISTHDVGKNIQIYNSIVSNSGDDGVLIRNPDAVVEGGVIRYSNSNGLQFGGDDPKSANGAKAANVKCLYNGADGINGHELDLDNCTAQYNGTAGISGVYGSILGGNSTYNGRGTVSGDSRDVAVELRYDSTTTDKKLNIYNLVAPQTGTQTSAIRLESLNGASASGLDPVNQMFLSGCDFSGYGDDLFYLNGSDNPSVSGVTVKQNMPATAKNNLVGYDNSGFVTLVGGSATFTNSNVRKHTPSSGNRQGNIITEVSLMQQPEGGTIGSLYQGAVIDKTSVEIESSSGTDTSFVKCAVYL